MTISRQRPSSRGVVRLLWRFPGGLLLRRCCRGSTKVLVTPASPSHLHQINIALPPDQQHGDEDLPPCCCRLRYGNTLVKPPPTPTPTLFAKPPEMAAPLPIEAAPLRALL